MKLITISLAQVREVEYQNKPVKTGIYKEAVPGTHRVTAMGLDGDVQVDRENHGGKDKAVYVYTVENYRYWEQELNLPLTPGQFGENFLVSGLPDEDVHIGDVFRIGAVTFQVTQPRVPCFKLGIKMGDPHFVRRFHHSGRVGFYLRVLEDGVVQAGDPVERLEIEPHRLSIRHAMLALTMGARQQEIICLALSIPALSQAWRLSLQKRLDGQD